MPPAQKKRKTKWNSTHKKIMVEAIYIYRNNLMNTIEINAILNILLSKGLINQKEYEETLLKVSNALLTDAENKGIIDRRVHHEILSSIYNNSL